MIQRVVWQEGDQQEGLLLLLLLLVQQQWKQSIVELTVMLSRRVRQGMHIVIAA